MTLQEKLDLVIHHINEAILALDISNDENDKAGYQMALARYKIRLIQKELTEE